MFKKTIKYEDYNGVMREEDFYFNYSMPEMMRLEHSIPGGYGSYLTRISKANDPNDIWNAFEEIIRGAYGVKSEDGKKFIKVTVDGVHVADDFMDSPAYEALMMELLSDADFASQFVTAIIPEKKIDSIVNGTE